MTNKKLMLAYDGSEHSQRALDWALDLNAQLLYELEIVTVIPPFPSLFADFPTDTYALMEVNRKNGQTMLEQAAAHCQERGQTATTALLEGHIVDTLIEHATEGGFTFLISGTRGAGGFEGLLLGSVAHKLVTYSPIPVLIVK